MTLAYLASPYSHPEPSIEAMRALMAGDAAAWLSNQGYHPFSPIAHWHRPAKRNKLPSNANHWISYNQAWLEKADELIVLKMPGWKDSIGIAYEIKWAKEQMKPVKFIENGNPFKWSKK